MSVVLTVLSVHQTAHYLGASRFGLWATFASMAGMLSFLDLGVGNALINRVAQVAALDSRRDLCRTVTGGIALLVIIGSVVTAVMAALASLLPWTLILNIEDPALQREAAQAALVFGVLFGINLCVGGPLRILAGQQRLHEANLASAVATGLACMALVGAAATRASVPWLLAATFGVQTLSGFIALRLLSRQGLLAWQAVIPGVRAERNNLLGTGSLFLVLQIGTMIGWGADSLLLATMRGTDEVAVYAVAQRLFQFASLPFVMLNAPLWAAYADARARKDIAFVRTTLRRSLRITLAGSAAVSLFLLLAGPSLLPLWTRQAVHVPLPVLVLFAVWTVLDACGNVFAMYLNGFGIVRQQVWVTASFCVLALPLKFLLGTLLGAAGMLTATITAYVIAVVGLYAFVFRATVIAPLQGDGTY